MKRRSLGIVQSIASGLCFGFLGLFGKYVYARGVVPGELLSLRFLFAALMTLIFLAFRFPKRIRLTRRELLSCAVLGIFGYAVFSLCFFSALTGLSVSLTVLLLYTYPVIVALGGLIFFGEKIPRDHLLALPLAALGLALLVWGDLTMERMEFLFLGIASAVFYALYILASSRWLKDVDPMISTPTIQSFAAMVLGAVYLRDIGHSLEIIQYNWILLLAIAFICTVLAMGLFLAGLQKLKSWEVSILSTTEPLTGVLLATLFLGERLSLLQTTGAAAIIFALVWVSRPSRKLEA